VYYILKLKTEGRSWENTAVGEFKWARDDKQAQEYAQLVANVRNVQVRWNRENLFQGHYVDPEASVE